MMQKLNHHPDRGGNVVFAQQLNDAVKTLCDPEMRAQYDAIFDSQVLARNTAAAEKQKNDRSKPSADNDWGEPGGSPLHPDANRSDMGSESAGPRKRPESDERGKTQRAATGHQPWNANRTGSKQCASSILQPLGAYCLFCKAKLMESDNRYPRKGNYTSCDFDLHRCQRCNGATTPITLLPGSSNNELRKLYRLEHSADALVWTHWSDETPMESSLCDFSPFGCSCLSEQALVIDHVLLVNTLMFNAICKVRHIKKTENSSYLIGLEFLTLDMQSAPGALLSATA